MVESWVFAQQSVIGSALIDPAVVPIILANTDPEDFSGVYRSAYNAIRALVADASPVDPVTLLSRIGDTYKSFVLDAMQATPTAANVEEYIRICREQSRIVRLQELGTQMQDIATMGDARALMEKAQMLCSDRPGLRIYTAAQAIQAFVENHQKAPREYLDWGFSKINDNVSLSEGKYVIIGGRPSSGKSALMMQLAAHIGQKHRVGVFSFETDNDTLSDRGVANAMQVSYTKIRKHMLRLEDWQHITRSAQSYSELGMETIEANGMTAADIEAVSLSRRYDTIFVDYVQLVEAQNKREMRTEQVSSISRALHSMAARHKVNVMALSQFSRPEKQKGGVVLPPTMEDLRESGQLEQDADVIMLLYRINPDDNASPRRLHICKNKEGTTGQLDLDFDGDHQTFRQAKTTYADIRAAIADAKRASYTSPAPAEPDNPFVQGQIQM